MDTQTTILLAFAVLCVAGLVVSVGGWVLFARERRALRGAHRWHRRRPARSEAAVDD